MVSAADEGSCTTVQGGSAAGTDSSNLQRYASFMQSPTPSLRLAAAALCSVLSKQFNRYTGRSKLDSELGGAVTSTLLSLIEHESELRARAAFIFGEGPLSLFLLPSLQSSDVPNVRRSATSLSRRRRAEHAATRRRRAVSQCLSSTPRRERQAREPVSDTCYPRGTRPRPRSTFWN